MAGGFTGPKATPPQMRHGHTPKAQGGAMAKAKPEYPISDSFASKGIPSLEKRKKMHNPKYGFHTEPARASHHHAQRPPKPSRGSGRVI